MLLAVDVGNSHTVLAAFDGTVLVRQWRMRTQRDATPDEVALTTAGLLASGGGEPRRVRALVVGCVVPPLRGVWMTVAREGLACPALAVHPGLDTGLRLDVDRPGEVGADRIADGVAALRLHGAPTIVVDCGTAITVDAIGGDGSYLGGAIAPGVGVSCEALIARTSLLQRVELGPPPRALGTSTAEQLLSGAVFGFAGLVDALVERVGAEMGGARQVVATGGWAALLVGASRTITCHDPFLTMHGLRLIYERCGAGDRGRSQDPAAGGLAPRPNMAPGICLPPTGEEGSP